MSKTCFLPVFKSQNEMEWVNMNPFRFDCETFEIRQR